MLGNKTYKKLPSSLYNKNLKLHSLKDIVEEFNNYFLSLGKNLSDNIPAINRSHDSYLLMNRFEELSWPSGTKAQVYRPSEIP